MVPPRCLNFGFGNKNGMRNSVRVPEPPVICNRRARNAAKPAYRHDSRAGVLTPLLLRE
jgi:hypothetical protein